jgi:glycosyltransferase involved in cell wall biosynthesis
MNMQPFSPIIVDGVFFKLADTGIARTWREILTRWQHTPWAERVVVIDRDGSLPHFECLRTIRCPMFDPSEWEADRVLMQNVCDEVGAGLFISSYYTRPERTPSVMMVYDMIPEVVEEWFDLSSPVWRQKHDAIRHAVGFACNSRNTLADLLRFFPAAAAKPSVVISRGVSDVFSPPSEEDLRAFRARIVIPHLAGRPYVLFVGRSGSYKNAAVLRRAFLGMWPWSWLRYAVLFTTWDPMVQKFRAIPGLVVHVADLADADLRLAYGAAECLVYPSLYEGFGQPPLEAMACGCPVICSNVASIPEVVGDAALTIDPRDPSGMRLALREVRKTLVAQELRRRGIERVKLFSWDLTAELLASFLSDCANRVSSA